jgi:uncharacterized protein involved in response to NO
MLLAVTASRIAACQNSRQSQPFLDCPSNWGTVKMARRITIAAVCQEPFRIFFPLAVLIGLVGAALWPLHFWGVYPYYPGQTHARLMAFGLFGGFILGFLGTAFPRMISVRSWTKPELGLLVCLYLAMTGSYLMGRLRVGDICFLALLGAFAILMASRWPQRRDIPPPGFPLVGLALLCAATGVLLSLPDRGDEVSFFWMTLPKLLIYQGFILLPILGVGGFLLPRFFGLESRHDFPESIKAPPGWKRQALDGLLAALAILLSFVLEAAGWHRTGPAVRLVAVLVYMLRVVPVFRATPNRNALATSLRLALLLVPAGYLAIMIFPEYRVGLLHLTLGGGFAVVTFTVATRVVYSHSGNQALLAGRNRWLKVTVWLILFAVATRISGDIWPTILVSHYIYGSIVWVIAVLIWAWYVLPKVLTPDTED